MTPQGWGNGAYFSNETMEYSTVVADVNGYGKSDLIDRGRCGRQGKRCWRLHRSDGSEPFLDPIGIGFADPEFTEITGHAGVQVADFDGDRRDEISYVNKCGAGDCWKIHRRFFL